MATLFLGDNLSAHFLEICGIVSPQSGADAVDANATGVTEVDADVSAGGDASAGADAEGDAGTAVEAAAAEDTAAPAATEKEEDILVPPTNWKVKLELEAAFRVIFALHGGETEVKELLSPDGSCCESKCLIL